MAFNKQKALEAARKYRDKGQKDKAIKEYLKVVREDPKDVRVWLKIGDLYAQKGAKQEATETYIRVAKFYGEQGFYLKAVAVYKQILKLDPRMVEVNLKLAELYRQLGLISDAMQHFETVAAFFHREGKTKEALATIRQLVELDPENVATRIKLAELYSKEKMVDEALTEFQHACDFLKRNNREDDYVKVAERLLWHKPDRVDLARELAGMYLKRRDPRRALQKLQSCFKADQRDVETLALLAQAFQALEQKGKTVSVLKELARVLDENGQRIQAEEVHRKILAYVPSDVDSLAFIGETAPETPMPRPRAERLASIAEGAASRSPSVAATGSMPIYEKVESIDEDSGFTSDFDLDDGPSLADGSVSAEVHADEIVKILTETDVYVKYGLHQKAIHHLRRVFELDDSNVEARERLKDIYRGQGRDEDAIAELVQLAEATAASEPDRAEQYVREILEVDPGHQLAVDLARRFRLDVTKAHSAAPVEIVDEVSDAIEFDLGTHNPTNQLDDVLDFGDLDLDDGVSGSGAQLPTYEAPESLPPSDFDDLDLGSEAAQEPEHTHRAPSESYDFAMDDPVEQTQRAPSESYGFGTDEVAQVGQASPPPERAPSESYDFGLDGAEPAEAPLAESTMEVSLDQVEAAIPFGTSDDLNFDQPPGPGDLAAGHLRPDSLEERLDAALAEEEARIAVGDVVTSPDADYAQAMELDESDLELLEEVDLVEEYDDDESELSVSDGSFVDGGSLETTSEDVSVTGESTPLGLVESQPEVTAPSLQAAPEFVEMAHSAPVDVSMVESEFHDPASPPHAAHTIGGIDAEMGVGPPPAVVDPTQEIVVDNIIEESAVDPASGVLEDDLDEADFYLSQGLLDEARDILKTLEERFPNNPLVASKLEEVENAEAEQVGSAPAVIDPTLDVDADIGKPAVMLENPIEDTDSDTHFDLGQAYREMGLFSEAVREFQKVLAIHSREVQCHLMIGLCYRDESKLSEAITQFKSGLYVANISDAEKFGLYYEIGVSYEGLSDPQEALYYYEILTKKDPDYRDVASRIVKIRGKHGAERRSTLDEETDSALDGLAATKD